MHQIRYFADLSCYLANQFPPLPEISGACFISFRKHIGEACKKTAVMSY